MVVVGLIVIVGPDEEGISVGYVGTGVGTANEPIVGLGVELPPAVLVPPDEGGKLVAMSIVSEVGLIVIVGPDEEGVGVGYVESGVEKSAGGLVGWYDSVGEDDGSTDSAGAKGKIAASTAALTVFLDTESV